MSNIYPQITFLVDPDVSEIDSYSMPDVNRENLVYQLNSKIYWIENFSYSVKKGDSFTLYGEEALRVYKNYIQNNINGNMRNKTGIAKLIIGDNTCITDSDCKNDCDSLNGFNISQSKKLYFSKK